MTKSPKRPKKPRDVVGAAVSSMRFLTEDERFEPPKAKAKKAPKKKR